MEGHLLSTARPYLRLFALLSLTPPPSFYGGRFQGKFWVFLFACYSCCIFMFVIQATVVNISILYIEIQMLEVEDFTRVQGFIQKIGFTVQLFVIHGNMLIHYRKLRRIYLEIAALEHDIDVAAQYFGGLRHRKRFRVRLAKMIGLWLVLLSILFPFMSLPAIAAFMDWYNKIITEFVMILFQTKLIEFSLYVLLVQELLLRLRHTLLRLQLELSACEERPLLQSLCLALQRNKLLVGRVWKLVGDLEAYFTLPMIFVFLGNSFAVLHIVNWVYIQAVNPYDCVNCRYYRFGNLMILLIDLLIPCWLSKNCIDTYLSFSSIIHDIRCGYGKTNPELLRNGLREYALQMEHLKMRFTCSNFFAIDLKNFAGVVLTLFTYSIILIQFKLQDLIVIKSKVKLNSS